MAFSMTDKLSALKGRSTDYSPADMKFGTSTDSRVISASTDQEINHVLLTVDEMTRTITQISQHVEQIKHNHSAILTSIQNQAEARSSLRITGAARDENDRLMEEVKTLSHRVHAELKRMKRELEQEGARGSADYRIRKAQYTTICRKFKALMEEYNEVQEDYREKSKDRMQRQLKYTGKQVTDEQLEEMLESENPQVFTQDILLETAQKRRALGEVEARHIEIMHLEANIRDLHEMFYDMALMVEEQGELIDLIELNVESAAVYTSRGKADVESAVVYKRSARKKKWIVCCIVSSCLLVLLIVVAIIVAVLVNRFLNQ